jgi:hypothetical protein
MKGLNGWLSQTYIEIVNPVFTFNVESTEFAVPITANFTEKAGIEHGDEVIEILYLREIKHVSH